MNEEQCMCYITYAVPKSMLPQFVGMETAQSQLCLYPPEFVPDWYRKSSFPEDDIED